MHLIFRRLHSLLDEHQKLDFELLLVLGLTKQWKYTDSALPELGVDQSRHSFVSRFHFHFLRLSRRYPLLGEVRLVRLVGCSVSTAETMSNRT